MTAAPERIIIFARWPEPGRSKTRLIPALGPAEAAELGRRMAERTLAWARALAGRRGVALEVRTTGCSPGEARSWLGPGPAYRDQGGGDLGERMSRALHQALQEGARRAVLVGTDCPGLDDAVLARALDLLGSAPLLLGPAADGGYYLAGLSRPAPELFQGVAWGGEDVLAQTLGLARAAGVEPALLPRLGDVDRPEDLELWRRRRPAPRHRTPGLISVVIPTLNEAGGLAAAVNSARSVAGVEVVVVDGGSRDGTAGLARRLADTVLATPPGRGRQLAAGARRAGGELLLFLHADTRLPAGWDAEVRRVLARPGVALGAFRFRVEGRGASYRLVELMVAQRCRWLSLPYGDQALFMTADALEAAGGHPRRPLMEDVALVERARRLGRVELSPLAAVSSGRAWRKRGVWGNTLHNWRNFLAYRRGVSPEELVRRYYR